MLPWLDGKAEKPTRELLCFKMSDTNFAIREGDLKFVRVGPDSGLFMRCTEDGKAYQCLIDYHEGGTIGGILGEGIWKRRGVRNYTFGTSPDLITLNENEAHPCPVLPDSWKSFWRIGEWNEVRARITGDPPTITTWVNGVQIMQHTEPASVHPAKGHLGLQVHGGDKFGGTVRYRNIRVRTLK